MLRNLGRKQAKKLLAAQLCISLLVAVAYGVFQGVSAATYALAGGLICVLANVFFFHQAFKTAGAQAAQKMMRGFIFGQMGKFVITVALFTLIFVVGQVQPWPLFLGYICTQAAFWLAPVLLKQRVIVNE